MDINNQLYSNLPRTVYVLQTKSGEKKYFTRHGEQMEEQVIQRGGSHFTLEDGEELKVHLEEIDREDLHNLRTFGQI